MGRDVTPSSWSVGHFGAEAPDVITRVVTALAKAQQAAWLVQEAAAREGASNRRPYGSMWEAKYDDLVDKFEDLPGFETYRPRGASYRLVLFNRRLFIPFRHSTTLDEPISAAKLGSKVPKMVSRHFGVQSPPTLFDESPDANLNEDAVPEYDAVIYVAFAANAGSDRVLRAWWGEATSLDDDGYLQWSRPPEQLPIELAYESVETRQPTATGTPADAHSFDHGPEPGLGLGLHPTAIEVPSAEPEPALPTSQDGDE